MKRAAACKIIGSLACSSADTLCVSKKIPPQVSQPRSVCPPGASGSTKAWRSAGRRCWATRAARRYGRRARAAVTRRQHDHALDNSGRRAEPSPVTWFLGRRTPRVSGHELGARPHTVRNERDWHASLIRPSLFAAFVK